jgi:hypothetical protein
MRIKPLICLASRQESVELGFDVLDSGLNGRSSFINSGKQRRRIPVAIIVRGCPHLRASNRIVIKITSKPNEEGCA